MATLFDFSWSIISTCTVQYKSPSRFAPDQTSFDSVPSRCNSVWLASLYEEEGPGAICGIIHQPARHSILHCSGKPFRLAYGTKLLCYQMTPPESFRISPVFFSFFGYPSSDYIVDSSTTVKSIYVSNLCNLLCGYSSSSVLSHIIFCRILQHYSNLPHRGQSLFRQLIYCLERLRHITCAII